jgi:hypothetical protein
MHVNTGNCLEERNVNCALCTAAALTGQSSGDVNADLQVAAPAHRRWGPFESDQAFITYVENVPVEQARRVAMGNPDLQAVADQMIGIAVYVASKLQTAVKFCGNPALQTRGSDVLPFMNRQPDGTRFAVFTADGTSLYGDEAHWIYAEKQNGQLTFRDYQTDTQMPPGAPTSSPHPLRPGGGANAAYATAKGATKADTYMIALAFGSNLVD